MRCLAVLCLLLLQTGTDGFGIFDDASVNHQEITESAILASTLQACASLAKAEGKDFTFPSTPHFPASVLVACDAAKSAKSYVKAIEQIQDENRGVDLRHFMSSRHHFDDEEFVDGRQLVTSGLSVVKASNKEQNFDSARESLGQLMHPLQDFYSHSNWVEMGNKEPNANLIKGVGNIGNIADRTRATCRNCVGDDCTNNILEDILREKILTSGYFSLVPFAEKPAGKCSHGGGADRTKNIEPIGGINKDTLESEHGQLHVQAAQVAIAATTQVLEDVRAAAGDTDFLKMLGINKGKPLCFVIDTTGSMGDDIATVRTVTSKIINSKVGTEDEPSVYILVPFNDPDFGPLTKTTDPEAFKNAINALSASGGGDYPEMCLSGLRLALTGAPPGSEIYVFTDATAKDEHLKSAVIALIEKTKSTVNFLLTGALGLRRRRQIDNDPQQQNVVMTRAGVELYSDLAQASGGQSIQVSKSQLLEATSIISESSAGSLVILLQASRNPGKEERFTFLVDGSVKNLTVYITGSSVTFNLISPSGVSQNSANTTGPLIVSSQTAGNFKTVRLNAEVGQWEIKMMSTNPYNLKVVGNSLIDFLFTFMKLSDSPWGGYAPIDNRPKAGVNGTLRVTLTDTSATVTDVTLVETSTSATVNGSVNRVGDGRFLVQFVSIPTNDFVVLVKGQMGNSSTKASSDFQRQSATSTRASTLAVTTGLSDTVIEPGESVNVTFTVATGEGGGNVAIRASNDQGFPLTFPSSLPLGSGGSANGTVTITAPPTTASGTVVTLTIEADNPGGTDTNFIVRRLAVLTTVTDFTQPTCELLSLKSNCSSNCNMSMWDVSLQVTDGPNGTGINSISFRQGDGTLNVNSSAGNITLVSYNASCCSPDVEIVVVDKVGNAGICSYTVRVADTTTAPTTAPTTSNTTQVQTTSAAGSLNMSALWVFLLCLSTTILALRS